MLICNKTAYRIKFQKAAIDSEPPEVTTFKRLTRILVLAVVEADEVAESLTLPLEFCLAIQLYML